MRHDSGWVCAKRNPPCSLHEEAGLRLAPGGHAFTIGSGSNPPRNTEAASPWPIQLWMAVA